MQLGLPIPKSQFAVQRKLLTIHNLFGLSDEEIRLEALKEEKLEGLREQQDEAPFGFRDFFNLLLHPGKQQDEAPFVFRAYWNLLARKTSLINELYYARYLSLARGAAKEESKQFKGAGHESQDLQQFRSFVQGFISEHKESKEFNDDLESIQDYVTLITSLNAEEHELKLAKEFYASRNIGKGTTQEQKELMIALVKAQIQSKLADHLLSEQILTDMEAEGLESGSTSEHLKRYIDRRCHYLAGVAIEAKAADSFAKELISDIQDVGVFATALDRISNLMEEEKAKKAAEEVKVDKEDFFKRLKLLFINDPAEVFFKTLYASFILEREKKLPFRGGRNSLKFLALIEWLEQHSQEPLIKDKFGNWKNWLNREDRSKNLNEFKEEIKKQAVVLAASRRTGLPQSNIIARVENEWNRIEALPVPQKTIEAEKLYLKYLQIYKEAKTKSVQKEAEAKESKGALEISLQDAVRAIYFLQQKIEGPYLEFLSKINRENPVISPEKAEQQKQAAKKLIEKAIEEYTNNTQRAQYLVALVKLYQVEYGELPEHEFFGRYGWDVLSWAIDKLEGNTSWEVLLSKLGPKDFASEQEAIEKWALGRVVPGPRLLEIRSDWKRLTMHSFERLVREMDVNFVNEAIRNYQQNQDNQEAIEHLYACFQLYIGKYQQLPHGWESINIELQKKINNLSKKQPVRANPNKIELGIWEAQQQNQNRIYEELKHYSQCEGMLDRYEARDLVTVSIELDAIDHDIEKERWRVRVAAARNSAPEVIKHHIDEHLRDLDRIAEKRRLMAQNMLARLEIACNGNQLTYNESSLITDFIDNCGNHGINLPQKILHRLFSPVAELSEEFWDNLREQLKGDKELIERLEILQKRRNAGTGFVHTPTDRLRSNLDRIRRESKEVSKLEFFEVPLGYPKVRQSGDNLFQVVNGEDLDPDYKKAYADLHDIPEEEQKDLGRYPEYQQSAEDFAVFILQHGTSDQVKQLFKTLGSETLFGIVPAGQADYHYFVNAQQNKQLIASTVKIALQLQNITALNSEISQWLGVVNRGEVSFVEFVNMFGKALDAWAASKSIINAQLAHIPQNQREPLNNLIAQLNEQEKNLAQFLQGNYQKYEYALLMEKAKAEPAVALAVAPAVAAAAIAVPVAAPAAAAVPAAGAKLEEKEREEKQPRKPSALVREILLADQLKGLRRFFAEIVEGQPAHVSANAFSQQLNKTPEAKIEDINILLQNFITELQQLIPSKDVALDMEAIGRLEYLYSNAIEEITVGEERDPRIREKIDRISQNALRIMPRIIDLVCGKYARVRDFQLEIEALLKSAPELIIGENEFNLQKVGEKFYKPLFAFLRDTYNPVRDYNQHIGDLLQNVFSETIKYADIKQKRDQLAGNIRKYFLDGLDARNLPNGANNIGIKVDGKELYYHKPELKELTQVYLPFLIEHNHKYYWDVNQRAHQVIDGGGEYKPYDGKDPLNPDFVEVLFALANSPKVEEQKGPWYWPLTTYPVNEKEKDIELFRSYATKRLNYLLLQPDPISENEMEQVFAKWRNLDPDGFDDYLWKKAYEPNSLIDISDNDPTKYKKKPLLDLLFKLCKPEQLFNLLSQAGVPKECFRTDKLDYPNLKYLLFIEQSIINPLRALFQQYAPEDIKRWFVKSLLRGDLKSIVEDKSIVKNDELFYDLGYLIVATGDQELMNILQRTRIAVLKSEIVNRKEPVDDEAFTKYYKQIKDASQPPLDNNTQSAVDTCIEKLAIARLAYHSRGLPVKDQVLEYKLGDKDYYPLSVEEQKFYREALREPNVRAELNKYLAKLDEVKLVARSEPPITLPIYQICQLSPNEQQRRTAVLSILNRSRKNGEPVPSNIVLQLEYAGFERGSQNLFIDETIEEYLERKRHDPYFNEIVEAFGTNEQNARATLNWFLENIENFGLDKALNRLSSELQNSTPGIIKLFTEKLTRYLNTKLPDPKESDKVLKIAFYLRIQPILDQLSWESLTKFFRVSHNLADSEWLSCESKKYEDKKNELREHKEAAQMLVLKSVSDEPQTFAKLRQAFQTWKELRNPDDLSRKVQGEVDDQKNAELAKKKQIYQIIIPAVSAIVLDAIGHSFDEKPADLPADFSKVFNAMPADSREIPDPERKDFEELFRGKFVLEANKYIEQAEAKAPAQGAPALLSYYGLVKRYQAQIPPSFDALFTPEMLTPENARSLCLLANSNANLKKQILNSLDIEISKVDVSRPYYHRALIALRETINFSSDQLYEQRPEDNVVLLMALHKSIVVNQNGKIEKINLEQKVLEEQIDALGKLLPESNLLAELRSVNVANKLVDELLPQAQARSLWNAVINHQPPFEQKWGGVDVYRFQSLFNRLNQGDEAHKRKVIESIKQCVKDIETMLQNLAKVPPQIEEGMNLQTLKDELEFINRASQAFGVVVSYDKAQSYAEEVQIAYLGNVRRVIDAPEWKEQVPNPLPLELSSVFLGEERSRGIKLHLDIGKLSSFTREKIGYLQKIFGNEIGRIEIATPESPNIFCARAAEAASYLLAINEIPQKDPRVLIIEFYGRLQALEYAIESENVEAIKQAIALLAESDVAKSHAEEFSNLKQAGEQYLINLFKRIKPIDNEIAWQFVNRLLPHKEGWLRNAISVSLSQFRAYGGGAEHAETGGREISEAISLMGEEKQDAGTITQVFSWAMNYYYQLFYLLNEKPESLQVYCSPENIQAFNDACNYIEKFGPLQNTYLAGAKKLLVRYFDYMRQQKEQKEFGQSIQSLLPRLPQEKMDNVELQVRTRLATFLGRAAHLMDEIAKSEGPNTVANVRRILLELETIAAVGDQNAFTKISETLEYFNTAIRQLPNYNSSTSLQLLFEQSEELRSFSQHFDVKNQLQETVRTLIKACPQEKYLEASPSPLWVLYRNRLSKYFKNKEFLEELRAEMIGDNKGAYEDILGEGYQSLSELINKRINQLSALGAAAAALSEENRVPVAPAFSILAVHDDLILQKNLQAVVLAVANFNPLEAKSADSLSKAIDELQQSKKQALLEGYLVPKELFDWTLHSFYRAISILNLNMRGNFGEQHRLALTKACAFIYEFGDKDQKRQLDGVRELLWQFGMAKFVNLKVPDIKYLQFTFDLLRQTHNSVMTQLETDLLESKKLISDVVLLTGRLEELKQPYLKTERYQELIMAKVIPYCNKYKLNNTSLMELLSFVGALGVYLDSAKIAPKTRKSIYEFRKMLVELEKQKWDQDWIDIPNKIKQVKNELNLLPKDENTERLIEECNKLERLPEFRSYFEAIGESMRGAGGAYGMGWARPVLASLASAERKTPPPSPVIPRRVRKDSVAAGSAAPPAEVAAAPAAAAAAEEPLRGLARIKAFAAKAKGAKVRAADEAEQKAAQAKLKSIQVRLKEFEVRVGHEVYDYKVLTKMLLDVLSDPQVGKEEFESLFVGGIGLAKTSREISAKLLKSSSLQTRKNSSIIQNILLRLNLSPAKLGADFEKAFPPVLQKIILEIITGANLGQLAPDFVQKIKPEEAKEPAEVVAEENPKFLVGAPPLADVVSGHELERRRAGFPPGHELIEQCREVIHEFLDNTCGKITRNDFDFLYRDNADMHVRIAQQWSSAGSDLFMRNLATPGNLVAFRAILSKLTSSLQSLSRPQFDQACPQAVREILETIMNHQSMPEDFKNEWAKVAEKFGRVGEIVPPPSPKAAAAAAEGGGSGNQPRVYAEAPLISGK